MSVRRVQEASGQDGRAQRGEGRCEEQLEGGLGAGELCVLFRPREAPKDTIDDLITHTSPANDCEIETNVHSPRQCGPRSAKRKDPRQALGKKDRVRPSTFHGTVHVAIYFSVRPDTSPSAS